MKKKIIIVSHNLRLGGVERSLIGLLHAIDYSRFEVDLFLFLHDGELMKFLPKEVNLLPENKKYAGLISSVQTNLKNFNFDVLWSKRKAKKAATDFIQKHSIHSANMVYDNYLQRFNLANLPVVSEQTYDLAISFLTPHYIATQKVKANKTIAWIHTDYSFFQFDEKAELAMWDAYDFIASISKDVTAGFVKQFPELKSKIVEIENILDPEFVRAQSEEFLVEDEMPTTPDELKLLSVGRFNNQKNFDQVPEIGRHLLDAGLKFKWYLIGYGGEENLIRQKISEFGMENHILILGKKDNPYPYMKACDYYLQPSRYEGKAVTVREAQMLAKPVVITAFATSQSQLKDGFDGLIVPMENEACAQAMLSVFEQTELTQQLIENCKRSDFGNVLEVKKIEKLLH